MGGGEAGCCLPQSQSAFQRSTEIDCTAEEKEGGEGEASETNQELSPTKSGPGWAVWR